MDKSVVELFAGVGGFRVAFNDVQLINDNVIESTKWQFVYANQWEPNDKNQAAFACYEKRFGESSNHVNKDIFEVLKELNIPKHSVLVGGFPCQDYSVARSLVNEQGILGKKGVLWWSIYDILKKQRTPFVLLENVDRLLKSPSKQRGRDFGIMLKCLDDLGYYVEWRVINAADYGFPQRRRRVYIFAANKSTKFYKQRINKLFNNDLILKGFYSDIFQFSTFETKFTQIDFFTQLDLQQMTNHFKFNFYNSGIVLNGNVMTMKIDSAITYPQQNLSSILDDEVDDVFYLSDRQKESISKLKKAKKIDRISPIGLAYKFIEGGINYPDKLDSPGRTMLTSEGSINRSTHVIRDSISGNMRFITPREAERLNGFPVEWTNTGMSIRKRYFCMGNALVVGVVRIMGNKLSDIIDKE